MDSNTIDLNRAERAVSQLLSNDEHQYQRTKLQSRRHSRLNYLLSYPTKSFGTNDHLLSPNVPGLFSLKCTLVTNLLFPSCYSLVTRLTPLEILRRQHGAYTTDALESLNNYHYGNNEFRLSEQDARELATRLHAGMSIITFNADRLSSIADFFLGLHESFRRKVLKKKDVALKEPTLNSKQMAIALEFYLQIDGTYLLHCFTQQYHCNFRISVVNVFYMKTCSFRGAHPSSIQADIKGLFCGKDQPQATYKLLPCGSRSCLCCYPVNHEKKSQPWLVVDFSSSSTHQFVNGYTTYLNCPAVCFQVIFDSISHTKNCQWLSI